MTSKDCIFCQIVKGEMKTHLIYESDYVVALNDINPIASVHVLIVPKKHIESVVSISNEDGRDVVEIFRVAAKIAQEKKLDAYRLSFNAGRFQHIPHLHMHLLAGSKIQWSKL